MKSKFLKATVLATAAIAVGALAAPVTAKTLQYTFGNYSGGAYCDGITLTEIKNSGQNPTWGGTHTGCTNNDSAGGYTVGVDEARELDIATTNTTLSSAAQTFFLYLPGNEWFMFTTTNGIFVQVDSGILISGAPPAKAKVGARPAGSPNPKRALDRMF